MPVRPPRSVPTPLRVLIADDDVERRMRLQRVIEGAGFLVTETRWRGFTSAFDIAVIDTAVATPEEVADKVDAGETATMGGRYGDGGQPAPVLFLTDSLDVLDFDALGVLPSSDWVLRPFPDEELAHRLLELVDYAERLRVQHRRAEGLREKVREISSRIWATNDPEVMTADLVTGLRASFGADDVCLFTFDDERVPRLSVVPDDAPTAPLEDGRESAAHCLAGRLWSAETVLALDEGMRDEPDELHALFELLPWLREGSWLILPMGQGASPFGFLCVGDAADSRAWSGLERSLLQHLVANLAHGLMQGHLITSQRRVVEQMRQLDQERDAMLATVNHELRTPLTSIVAYLELVRDGEGGLIPDEASEMLAVVERNAARLRSLIEDALALAQKNSPHDRAALPGEVDVRRTVQSVIDSLWPIATARGIEVALAAPEADAALVVPGDEGELERVFTNLVGNAVKFSPDGGRVQLDIDIHTGEDSAPEVSVTVTDSGVGIPAEDLPRLFTRFFRASNATRAAVPGTGLGLAIAKEIVEAHEGTIALSSHLGAGTSVVVRLPHLPAATPADVVVDATSVAEMDPASDADVDAASVSDVDAAAGSVVRSAVG